MKESILEAAFAELVGEGPELPASSVARRAGVSKALIFHHFGSHEGLLDAMAARVLEETQQGLGRLEVDYPNPRDRLAALARALLSAAAQPPPDEARRVLLFWLGGDPPRAALRDSLLADFIAQTLREGASMGAARPGLEPGAVATRVLGRWHGLTILHAAGGGVDFDQESDRLADELDALLLPRGA